MVVGKEKMHKTMPSAELMVSHNRLASRTCVDKSCRDISRQPNMWREEGERSEDGEKVCEEKEEEEEEDVADDDVDFC